MIINFDFNLFLAKGPEKLPTPVWETDPDVWSLFVAIGCLQMALDCWKIFHESLVLQAERAKEGEMADERHPRWTRGIGVFHDDNRLAALAMRWVDCTIMNDSRAFHSLNVNKHLQFRV